MARVWLVNLSLCFVALSASVQLENVSLFCGNSCSEEGPQCDCDPLCSLFGECCLDSDYVAAYITTPVHCVHIGGRSTYQISKCDTSFFHDTDRCDSQLPPNKNPDPYDSIPVTSVISKTTYKNVHCLKCNLFSSSYVYWRVLISISVTPEYPLLYSTMNDDSLINILAYFRRRNEWGLWLWTGDRYAFFPVAILIRPPRELEPRECDRDLFDTGNCPDDWKDDRIRELCAVYRDTVNYRGRNYKNKHCALCHGAGEQDLSCNTNQTLLAKVFTRKAYLSFGSGDTKPCQNEGKMYDVFAKKCRFIVELHIS